MHEYYNLPILFSDEEREQYAAWGRKKVKLFTPYAIIITIVALFLLIGPLLLLFHVVDDIGWIGRFLRFNAERLSYVYDFSLSLLLFLTIKPLDMFFDKVFKKPRDPRMLRIEPSVDGVLYRLMQGKKLLSEDLIPWEEWEDCILPEDNQILIEDNWLTIGANTRKFIYNEPNPSSLLDCPAEKITTSIKLQEIQKKLNGYLASLDEMQREREWERQHPDLFRE